MTRIMTAPVLRPAVRMARQAGYLAGWTAAAVAAFCAGPTATASTGSLWLGGLVAVASVCAAAEAACVGSWRLRIPNLEYATAWMVVAAADAFVILRFAAAHDLGSLWARNVGPFLLIAAVMVCSVAVA